MDDPFTAVARVLFEDALSIIRSSVAEEPSRADFKQNLTEFQDKLNGLESEESAKRICNQNHSTQSLN